MTATPTLTDATLTICGRTWTISMVPHAIDDDGKACLGICDKATQRIEIGTTKSTPEVLRASLLHEALHACIYTVVNNYPSDEEALVQALEVALYDMIRCPTNAWFWQLLAPPALWQDTSSETTNATTPTHEGCLHTPTSRPSRSRTRRTARQLRKSDRTL